VVLLDQRGCGASAAPKPATAADALRDNDTPRLVADIEAVREAVGVEKWHLVLGGSWGTTLALAYAQEHASRVAHILLRGVCAMRRKEILWMFGSSGGAATMDPRGWGDFASASHVPGAARAEDACDDAVLRAYHDALAGDDAKAAASAAMGWMRWEGRVSSLGLTAARGTTTAWNGTDWSVMPKPKARRGFPGPGPPPGGRGNATANGTVPVYAQPLLTSYYSLHQGFFPEGGSVVSQDRVDRLRDAGIGCTMVQGQRDTVCPPATALDLHRAWPEAELRLVGGAGHSQYDPGILSELVEATDRIAGRE